MDFTDALNVLRFWLPVVGLGAGALVVLWPSRRWSGALALAYALLALPVALEYVVSWWWPGDSLFNGIHIAAAVVAAVALALSLALLGAAGRPRAFVLGALTAGSCVASAAALFLSFFLGSGQ